MQKNIGFIKSHPFLYLLIINFLLLFFLSPVASAFGKDELEVKQDREKTVYTIDSNEDQKKDTDKENAWEMLKNKNMWIEKK